MLAAFVLMRMADKGEFRLSKLLKSWQLRTIFYNTIRIITSDVREKKYDFNDPIVLHRYAGEKALVLLKDITIRFKL